MSRHLKRLLAPKFWKIEKKKSKWVVRPSPGPHPLNECIPLLVLVRDILKLVENASEGKKIIKRGEILVDGKVRKDPKFPAGLFDVISIPRIDKNYRVVPTKEGLELVEIDKEEKDKKLCKIVGKNLVKKGKIQLHLHDGKNILVESNEYSTHDSILIELSSLKILEHLKMEKGNLGIVIRGKNRGVVAKIMEVKKGGMLEKSKVVCQKDEKEFVVLKDHFFVVGKEKPLIKVGKI